MNDILNLRENTYNLGNVHILESQNPTTKQFVLDSIAYIASQLWKNLAEEIRNSASLPIFKEKIKKVPLISCSCNFVENTSTTWDLSSFFTYLTE